MKVLDSVLGQAIAWEDESGITVVRRVESPRSECVPNAEEALTQREFFADVLEMIEGGVCIEHYSAR